jgi:hypothetical protein
MIPARVYHYRDPAAVAIGLGELRRTGLTPRGLLFIALDPRGETYLAVPDDLESVTSIRVGDKLTLKPPWEGRYFHIDAVHRIPGGVLWNGDRRLGQTGSASEVACAIAEWLKGASAKNVFLGCTPHQPGAWWAKNERSAVVALHSAGYVDAVVATSGLLARRIGEPTLFYLPWSALAGGGLLDGWNPAFESTLGNILMVERRVLNYRLVLSCEHGLLEVDVSGLPDVRECDRLESAGGHAVVGRVDGEAFAVTRGVVAPWGLDAVRPALLVGAPNQALEDLVGALPD